MKDTRMTRGIITRTSPGRDPAALIGWAVVGLICCVHTAAEGSEDKQPRSGMPKCIVGFGDSITRGYGVPPGAGWVELLPELLKNGRQQMGRSGSVRRTVPPTDA